MGFSAAIDNQSLFRVRSVLLPDREGRDLAVAVAKLTWALGRDGRVTIAATQAPVRSLGVGPYTGAASLLFPNDLVAYKPGTDVLLAGTAYPPARDATEGVVRLRAMGRRSRIDKALRVFGPRVYFRGLGGVAPGPAARLAPTPLVWELAYGGVDRATGTACAENPAGVGFAADPTRLVDTPAPAIEGAVPNHPACFAPVASGWEPRASRAGTMDAAWDRERAPLAPLDRDPRHACVAPDDQWLETPLEGGDRIEVHGTEADGAPLAFSLPRYEPVFESIVLGRSKRLPTHLDTVVVDADARRVELVYRAAARVPQREFQLEALRVSGSAPVRSLPLERPLAEGSR